LSFEDGLIEGLAKVYSSADFTEGVEMLSSKNARLVVGID
jgi:hypothetical protein